MLEKTSPEFLKKGSLTDFLNKKIGIHFVDAYERQIKELFFLDNKKFIGISKNEVFENPEFNRYKNKKIHDFELIFYPWNATLVKCVKEDEYFRLKTNRNQDLITAEEQKELSEYKIGVFGMSVGSNIAYVLTQTGISKSIVIADFDELDTTNLNRIWAGIHQVGINKAVIAARRIYEDNPYAKVTTLTDGIDAKKLENLLQQKKIDCIVEEIDQMQMKIETRKLAKKYKVPVLMVTDNGDWAVLHIERYDLGYDKIFEKDFEYWDMRMKNYASKKDFADIVINDIVGGPDKVDPKMLRSAEKVISKELISWPQLGSSALLGGVATTVAVKRIVTGTDTQLFRRQYLKALA